MLLNPVFLLVTQRWIFISLIDSHLLNDGKDSIEIQWALYDLVWVSQVAHNVEIWSISRDWRRWSELWCRFALIWWFWDGFMHRVIVLGLLKQEKDCRRWKFNIFSRIRVGYLSQASKSLPSCDGLRGDDITKYLCIEKRLMWTWAGKIIHTRRLTEMYNIHIDDDQM